MLGVVFLGSREACQQTQDVKKEKSAKKPELETQAQNRVRMGLGSRLKEGKR